jgi:hypothetical protein
MARPVRHDVHRTCDATCLADKTPTDPPPLREECFQFRPRGRTYDPRVQLIKDTPGPLIITEVGIEAATAPSQTAWTKARAPWRDRGQS